MSKTALICGVSGQDGAYLAELLLSKGYKVWGTSRDAAAQQFSNLKALGIRDRVVLKSMSTNDFRSVLQTITSCEPDEIYNLSGQSSVGLSFEQPIETLDSVQNATTTLLEVIRYLNVPVKFYNAGSGECFGNTGRTRASEASAFQPRSPYGVAKSAAYWIVNNYREAYDINAGTGILFNHESPLRPSRFVTRKIVSTAVRISKGSQERLRLGNTQIIRDWGWAPEYVEAMWLMLQAKKIEDYVIATGESHSLQDFVSAVFALLGLESDAHVIYDHALFRPTDIAIVNADPAKAKRQLGWAAKTHMQEVAKKMVAAEQAKQANRN